MSLTKSFYVATAMGMAFVSTSAFAGEYDGKYQFEYQVIGTAGNVCPTIKGKDLPCMFINADLRLYSGEFTEESIQSVANDAIGEFEAQSGHQVSAELEAQIELAVAELYGAIGEQMNAGLDFLPHKLEIAGSKWDPSAVMGSMMNAYGDTFPVFGTVKQNTGDYVLNGLYHGYFDRNDAYSGKGSVEIPVATAVEYEDVLLTIDGTGFAAYNSWKVTTDTTTPPPSTPPRKPRW